MENQKKKKEIIWESDFIKVVGYYIYRRDSSKRLTGKTFSEESYFFLIGFCSITSSTFKLEFGTTLLITRSQWEEFLFPQTPIQTAWFVSLFCCLIVHLAGYFALLLNFFPSFILRWSNLWGWFFPLVSCWVWFFPPWFFRPCSLIPSQP